MAVSANPPANPSTPGVTGVPGAPEIPGYEILDEIGRGGFATVFAGKQAAVGGRVAVKVISTVEADPDLLLRFERESLAMGALRGHPHIVTVLDAGHTEDQRPYIVMDLFEAGSLHGELTRRLRSDEGPFPFAEVLDIGVKVASAVAAAHSRGILHRDLKPGNILISDYGEPLLTDFGIARLADKDASVNGHVLSAGFTAAEIIEGGQPSVASDLFSLGATLYTLLDGRSPFRRTGDQGMGQALHRTLAGQVPDLRPQDVPDAVCVLLETALARDPDDRFEDATAMGVAFQRVQEDLGLSVSNAPFPTEATVRAPTHAATATVDLSATVVTQPPHVLVPPFSPATPPTAVKKWWRRST
ncbi:MAG: serine/threonine-protein kinase [Euzebya sp.]